MQQTPTQRWFSLASLLTGALLCAVPLYAVGALTDPENPVDPVVDTSTPTAISGIPNVVFDAPRGVLTPDMATQIAASVTVTDEIDFGFKPSGTLGPLVPGRYIITWTATDLGLNSLVQQQTVDVRPTIDLMPDQTVGEGGSASVSAHLNGLAPSYPVSVPYTVGGTADSSDHGALDGTFVFNEGETTASISFPIVNDGAGDAGETVSISLGALPAQLISGHQNTHQITISETNLAPVATLQATQGGGSTPTRAITTGGGTVRVSAMAYDANGDSIHFDWSASDNALAPIAGTTGSSFEFEPLGLVAGFYTVRLTVSDVAGLTSAYDMLLRVFETAPALSNDDDTDNDDSDDLTEGFGDSDNDGIPDYLDGNRNPALMQAFEPYIFDASLIRGATLVGDSISLAWALSSTASNLILYPLMIAAEPGTRIGLGPTVFAAGNAYARLSTSRAESLRGAQLDSGLVSGDGQVVDVQIGALGQAGKSARLIVPQTAPIPPSLPGTQPTFMVFTSLNSWAPFSTLGGDQILTASRGAGNCPDFFDLSPYANALAAGDDCLLIHVQDGGPNDYDGLANGVIRLMGGVFVSSTSGATTSGNGGTFSGDSSARSESLDKLNLGTGKGGGSLEAWSLLLLAGWCLSRYGRRRNGA